jgi:alanine racemase
MPEVPAPPLRLSIDSAVLASNWQALDRLSGSARAGAAVKANAYGLSARVAVPILTQAGCRDFFVAYAAEAAELDGLIDPGAISILHGPQSAEEAATIAERGWKPVLNSLRQVALWRDAAGGACDVMVDTGINRLGLMLSELGDPLLDGLDVDVLLSHLASAEEDSPLNAKQLKGWNEARGKLPHRRASLANSAGIMLGAEYHGGLTRPGLSLYGGVPCEALAPHIRQVVTPQAALMQVRTIAAGESVGYNATFVAQHPMRIGIVALGYADGYLRAWSGGKGLFRHGNAALPVLGRVSMDMTIIDLAAAPQLGEGDWVDVAYNLPEASRSSGLSQYELLTLLGRRFRREA